VNVKSLTILAKFNAKEGINPAKLAYILPQEIVLVTTPIPQAVFSYILPQFIVLLIS
jgi:hypothetical protein